MNYLHSPSRHHRLTSKSPTSIFDSPTLSGHRFSDAYQALSCESPPPNFDHLQTPLQPPRRTLEWGANFTENQTHIAATTPTTIYTTDLYKSSPRRSSLKSPSSNIKIVTPSRHTPTDSVPTATSYKSPIERTKWSTRSISDSPVKKADTTPTRHHLGSLSSTPPKSQHHENVSPMNYNDPTSISSPLKMMTSTELLYNKSPLDAGAPQDIDNSYRTSRRPLEYIRSPIRNMTDNYIYDNTNSPVRSNNISNSNKTPTPIKSTPTAATPPKPLDSSPKYGSPYRRRLSFDAVSPLVDNSYQSKGDADESRPVTTTTYRSPVYSNSSYSQYDKRSKTPISQPSPIAISSTDTRYVRPASPPSPIQPVRSQKSLSTSLFDQEKPEPMDERRISQSSLHEHERHVQHDSPSKKQLKEGRINNSQQHTTTHSTPSSETRISSSTNTTATATAATPVVIPKSPQMQPVDRPHYSHYQQTKSTNNVAPKSPVTHRPYRSSLPHYMRTTESYKSRLQAQTDDYHHTKLHKTKLGGVTKKTHSPRIQPFRSTTKINALDDIKNEMAPEEVYVSLAERVKQFEKGLGNGGKSTLTKYHHHHTSNVDHSTGTHAHGLTQAKSPYLLTRQRSANSSYHRHDLDEPPLSVSSSTAHHRLSQEVRPPHIDQSSRRSHAKRQRSTTTSAKDEDGTGKSLAHQSKKRKQQHQSVEVKPFHFATDDRAARYQQAFRAKLDLWKEKDLKGKRQ